MEPPLPDVRNGSRLFHPLSSFTAVLGTRDRRTTRRQTPSSTRWPSTGARLGLPALSLNWGAWSMVGAAAEPRVDECLKAMGAGTISPDQGLPCSPRCGVPVRPRSRSCPSTGPMPTRTGLGGRCSPTSPLGSPRRPAASRIFSFGSQGASSETSPLLVDHVRAEVAKVLGLEGTASIEPRQGFFETGDGFVNIRRIEEPAARAFNTLSRPPLLLTTPTRSPWRTTCSRNSTSSDCDPPRQRPRGVERGAIRARARPGRVVSRRDRVTDR